ncbi:MAG: 2-hydroxyglutaryl-CoA dehydratase [Hydrocarboniphaga sp.]|uniref:acyl-CoA dehydratase activase n=1 Tax=Hydrocarboniphaga sp. TaxID=2033016 RepID=UPI002633BD95|nr:acyl-CoA dehydratase activase [Hydrocarboniphaga sp.]MDB5971638.1 2-hydroxyglutaryl-CoA dehydratase [Hydrocarboniphaga sp.]
MKSYVMGIDFGSTTTKTVILDLKGKMVASCVASKGSISAEGVQVSMDGAFAQAGIAQKDIARTVSTGYGRRMIDVADQSYTEITCHARGAIAMFPEARLVIDIGGQDSKVIAVSGDGLVQQFAMNDRCAAGTGKFLEALARAVQVPVEAMGALAMSSTEKLTVSNMCATFAETEVISLLAEGKSKPDVLGAVHAAIASRTAGLVARVGNRNPIVMTGGVAKNHAAVHYIEQALSAKMLIAPDPQIAGALGAALFALDEVAKPSAAMMDEEDGADEAMSSARGCATQPCKTAAKLPANERPLLGPM